MGERGQVVLPIEARKKFGINAGDKLLVLCAESAGFQRIVFMKTDALSKMMEHLGNFESFAKTGDFKNFEKIVSKKSRKK